jgi:hypothetical protein
MIGQAVRRAHPRFGVLWCDEKTMENLLDKSTAQLIG